MLAKVEHVKRIVAAYENLACIADVLQPWYI